MTQINRHREIEYAMEAALKSGKISCNEYISLCGFVNKEDVMLYLSACERPGTQWHESEVMSRWEIYLEYMVKSISRNVKPVPFSGFTMGDYWRLAAAPLDILRLFKQTGNIFIPSISIIA